MNKNSDFQLYTFNNKAFLSPEGNRLRNEAFRLWKDQWVLLYAEKGSHHVPSADGFFRYDLMNCLFHKDQIVGLFTHSFIDTGNLSSLDVEFFQTYDKNFLNHLSRLKLSRLMTFESLLVSPDFRVNQHHLPLGRLFLQWGADLMRETTAEAAVAIARADNRVSEKCQDLGFSVVQANIDCRNFPCDLLVMPRADIRPFSVNESDFQYRRLWQERISHLGTPYHVPETEVVRRKKIA